MYIQVTNKTKQRLIQKIRRKILEHPDFADTLVTNKIPAKSQPSKAIVISSASGPRRRFDLGDLIREHEKARCGLIRTVENPSTSIEWVVDNQNTLVNEWVTAGFYFVSITKVPTYNAKGTFDIVPVLKAREVFEPGVTVAELARTPIEGRMKVYAVFTQSPYDVRDLYAPSQYVYDASNNEVVLPQPLPREELVVEYLYDGTAQQNIEFSKNSYNTTALPGVVIAFGDRPVENDQQVVMVGSDFGTVSYDVYGGGFDLDIELTVYALDPDIQERMVDYLSVWLWYIKNELEAEDNMILHNVSIGGDSTDLQVEISSVPYFTATVSLEVTTHWEVRLPKTLKINGIHLYDTAYLDGSLTDEEIAKISSSLIQVADLGSSNYVFDTRARLFFSGITAI